MENLFKSLEDTKVETKIVTNSSVTRIKTLLNIMFITSQDGKESDQENPSDSITPPLNKGKARISMLQDLEFKNFIKTPIGTARVYNTFFITKPKLPKKDWEWYIIYITAQQAKRGYLRFRKSKTKEKILREKW